MASFAWLASLLITTSDCARVAAPSNPMPSQPSGNKLAVLVGFGFPHEGKLRCEGCIPGSYKDLKVIFPNLVKRGFPPRGIHIITDEPPSKLFVGGLKATMKRWDGTDCAALQELWSAQLQSRYKFANVHYLRTAHQCPHGTEGGNTDNGIQLFWKVLFSVSMLQPGDFLVLHLSTHGTTREHKDQDELDGLDEFIVIPGSDRSMYIRDNDVYTWLTMLPPKADVLFTADVCHGGGLADLPYKYTPVYADVQPTVSVRTAQEISPILGNITSNILSLSGWHEQVAWDRPRDWCLDMQGVPRVNSPTPFLPAANVFFIASANSSQTADNETVGESKNSFSQIVFGKWLTKDHHGESLASRTDELIRQFRSFGATQVPYVSAYPTIKDDELFHMFTGEKAHSPMSSGGPMQAGTRVLAPKTCPGSSTQPREDTFIVEDHTWPAWQHPNQQGWVAEGLHHFLLVKPAGYRMLRQWIPQQVVDNEIIWCCAGMDGVCTGTPHTRGEYSPC